MRERERHKWVLLVKLDSLNSGLLQEKVDFYSNKLEKKRKQKPTGTIPSDVKHIEISKRSLKEVNISLRKNKKKMGYKNW